MGTENGCLLYNALWTVSQPLSQKKKLSQPLQTQNRNTHWDTVELQGHSCLVQCTENSGLLYDALFTFPQPFKTQNLNTHLDHFQLYSTTTVKGLVS